MSETEALAQLKDIHVPEPIYWWPLAPGWYLLFFLAVFLMVSLSYFFYKKALHAAPKKQALVLLRSYQRHYQERNDTQLTSSLVSELLRRVALIYFPRKQVASLHGTAWIDFLNQTSKGIDFTAVQRMLLEAPFKDSVTTDESEHLILLLSKAQLWIKQRKVPCSN